MVDVQDLGKNEFGAVSFSQQANISGGGVSSIQINVSEDEIMIISDVLVTQGTTTTMHDYKDSSINLQVPQGKKWRGVFYKVSVSNSPTAITIYGSKTLDTADGNLKQTITGLTTAAPFSTTLIEFTAGEFITLAIGSSASSGSFFATFLESDA